MDIYDEEFIRFWSALYKHQAAYIMVGGFATNIHGYSRRTDDTNAWLKDTAENKYASDKP